MQRLKQHNLGAQLRMNEGDFLLGFRRPLPHRGTLHIVRFHVEKNGYAERAFYEISSSYSHFSHCSVQLDERLLGPIQSALRIALAEQTTIVPEDEWEDHNFDTLEFRDGDLVHRLQTAWAGDSVRDETQASYAVWKLIESQFPTNSDRSNHLLPA